MSAKIKHNKKRNTAFLYEVLVRHLTKSVIDNDSEKKRLVASIIKEHLNIADFRGNKFIECDH